jgi:beta-glucosidase
MTPAGNFDDYQGTQLVDQSKASGTAAAFTAAVARATTGTATIEIRLDNPVSGPLIGTATVPSTGDAYSYTTISASLARAGGIHDVYLVFTGDTRIASLSMK